MPSLIVFRSRLRVAAVTALALLIAVPALPQTSKPAPAKPNPPRPAAPATRKPPVQPAKPVAAKPVPAKAPEPLPPDVVVTTRYVTGDSTTTSTVSMKEARQRIDYGSEMSVLQECDLGRMIQVSDANKKFLVAAASAAPSVPVGTAKGVVTYTTSVTDTGERKEMFGTTARRIRTTLTKEATPNACDNKKERVETDGWYIDTPAGALCAASARAAAPASNNSDCRDDIKIAGADLSKIGYPIAYTMVTTNEQGKASTMAMEVTDLTRSTLPAAMFTVPDGYVEVKTLEALVRPDVAPPKKAGALRVGVAPIGNKANGDISVGDLHEALVVSLGEAEVDAVLLTGATVPELTADARGNDADFILTTEVVEVKQGGGGMLGKLSGTSQQSFSAKVDFELLPVAGGKPRLSESERSGTSTLKMALGAAKMVSMYVSPLGMMGARYNFMGTFAQLSNGTSAGTMQQSPDPVLNTVFSLVDRASGGPPETNLLTAGGAVASAMEREVKAVASELKKKR